MTKHAHIPGVPAQRERMSQNPMAELYRALAKARGEFPAIPKTRKATVRMKAGGSYSYMYADLADVFNAVDPALSAYGLSVMQHPAGGELVTVLAHESGATKEVRFPLHVTTGNSHPAQEYQKAITFAKRYALTALLGVATEESIEGDDSRKVNGSMTDTTPDRNFQGADGNIGVKGVTIPEGASPEKKAKLYAEGIIEQFTNAKTPAGVNGAWNRHEQFIDRFNQSYPDLYREVFDAFHARLEALNEEEKE